MATFSTKSLHFPGGVPKNKKAKILDSSGLAFAKTLKSLFFVFFGTSSGNGNVFTKSLHFPGGVPKKSKKSKDFGLFKPRLRQDSKIFFFGYLLRKWQRFPPKAGISWSGTKKPNKSTILDSSGLAFAKTLKSLFFLFFWYLLRKWQHFLSWLLCLLTTVSRPAAAATHLVLLCLGQAIRNHLSTSHPTTHKTSSHIPTHAAFTRLSCRS